MPPDARFPNALGRVGWPLAGLVALAAVAVALFVIGATRRAAPPSRMAPVPARTSLSAATTLRPAHVAVIVMENQGYGSVIGNRAAPFINRLARRYALARAAYAVAHPSLPNYLALTGGSTFGVDDDCGGCMVSADNLVTQLQAAGLSWKAYMENLPRPCFTGAAARDYANKHDPFLHYTQIARSPALCSRVVPLMQLARDERSGRLPRFVWITPDLCHDMHDCSVSTGDRFLARLVPPLLRALGRRGVLFLTWDEGDDDRGCCRAAHGGHVATIVAGPGARPGARLDTPTDHYSVLATIEAMLGLPRLRWAACACTPSLAPLLIGS